MTNRLTINPSRVGAAAVALALLGTGPLAAQAFETEAAAGGPPAMAFAGSSGMPANDGRVLLLEGYNGAGRTFAYADGAWQQLTTTNPPARYMHAMARATVPTVFGGLDATTNQVLGDTWQFVNGSWTQVATAGPAARSLAAMAEVRNQNFAVLFGGNGAAGTPLAGTFHFVTGLGWFGISISGAKPVRRSAHAMCAHPTQPDRVLLYGGVDAAGNVLSDFWEYDAAALTWTQLSASAAPGPRNLPTMTCDPTRGRVVLIGGVPGSGGGAAPTSVYEWNGTWTNVTPAGAVPTEATTVAATASYEPTTAEVVLFGTDGVTSSYGPISSERAEFTSLQVGCGATLSMDFATEPAKPYIGRNAGIRVQLGTPSVPTEVAWYWIANQYVTPATCFYIDTSSPLLSVQDMPLPVGTTTFTYSTPIPNDPALVGSSLYLQVTTTIGSGAGIQPNQFTDLVEAYIGRL